ncbi:MAG: S1C family serine protease [Candidatus Limnocylindria bacterium]
MISLRVLGALVLAAALAACEPLASPPLAAPTAPGVTQAPAAPGPVPAGAGLDTAVRDVAKRVKPAVVQITNQQVQIDQFNQPQSVPAGVGSGVIYDSAGHILTNAHVVSGAQNLQVSLTDGRSFAAKLAGADPLTDLAVVKIDAPDLPVAQLGDSGDLQVGDWVVAIGNALALSGGPTVSVGVVGALGRTVQEPSDTGGAGPFLFDVIQTDAAINPGNSGGPLCDLQGRVIGINTLVAGQAEPGVQAQGIGFAIAIARARPIADQLVSTGRVVHPFLGVSYTQLTPSIASQLGVSAKSGVVISQVSSGSPAAAAGIRARDVITAIEGQELKDESALARIINDHKAGDTISIDVARGGQTLKVQAKLAERQ